MCRNLVSREPLSALREVQLESLTLADVGSGGYALRIPPSRL
jgi:hypothetical protein